MALSKVETSEQVEYTDSVTGSVITVAKDENNVDVRQVTPVEAASGQTWQKLKAYLDTKVTN